jgi:hypothetical protein
LTPQRKLFPNLKGAKNFKATFIQPFPSVIPKKKKSFCQPRVVDLIKKPSPVEKCIQTSQIKWNGANQFYQISSHRELHRVDEGESIIEKKSQKKAKNRIEERTQFLC